MALVACGVNLALWAAFQVLDEVFLAYQPEGVHRVIFGNQILTLLMLYLLPTQDDTSYRAASRFSSGARQDPS